MLGSASRVTVVAHYAEASCVHPGQKHNGVGHAKHCPKPVVSRDRFSDRPGEPHESI